MAWRAPFHADRAHEPQGVQDGIDRPAVQLLDTGGHGGDGPLRPGFPDGPCGLRFRGTGLAHPRRLPPNPSDGGPQREGGTPSPRLMRHRTAAWDVKKLGDALLNPRP